MGAFSRLLRAHALLRRSLEAEVLAPHGLTLSDFEALVHLWRAEDGRMRRVDLAGQLTLSPSGITRLLDGLQDAGYVAKEHCATDARVTYAVLTDAGRELLVRLHAHHTAALRRLFGDALDDDDVDRLTELLERLPGVGGGDPACPA